MAHGEHPFESLEAALTVACEPDEPLPTFPTQFTAEAHDFMAHCLTRDCKARYAYMHWSLTRHSPFHPY